ncbi:MAG: hypothetical protein WC565_04100 [Parcubacteria group bacterium]|jgi:hypothetical protein
MSSQNAVNKAAESIRTLALYNPKLAYMLTRGQPLQPRIYNVTFQWDSAAVNQPIRGTQLNEPMYQMFWVKYMTYSIQRPTANVGAFFQRQQDEYTKRNPYVDITFRITGRGDKNTITDVMTPIEHLASPAGSPNKIELDWVLSRDANFRVDAVNTRAFNDEVPYIVRLSLVGLELSGCELPGCSYDEVVCALRNEELYPQIASDVTKVR